MSRPPWREAAARRADQRQGCGAGAGRGHDAVAVTTDPALRGLSDPDLFEVAQRRAVVTYNRADFEAIIREYAAANREHHGLVIIHPVRFPSHEFSRLATALAGFMDAFPPGKSFVTWLQEPHR